MTALVRGIDDRYAIFGSGEEIAAEFDATKLPALPAHWKRDYFFYANGFVKDMDWWDASPFTVAQLPFHGMSTYPYPANEEVSGRCGCAGLPVELERPLRFGRAGAVVSVRLSTMLPSTPPRIDVRTRESARQERGHERTWCLRRRCGNWSCCARGEISVAELAEAHIAQIERLNPQLNAFADFDAERVRAQARQHRCVARNARAAAARPAGHREVVDRHRGISSARSAACCTRARFRAKMRWWWRGCARRER